MERATVQIAAVMASDMGLNKSEQHLVVVLAVSFAVLPPKQEWLMSSVPGHYEKRVSLLIIV